VAEHKIIHISDLHFDEKGNSLLQNSEFLDAFLESLKKLDKTVDTLIISGDIVDRGGTEIAYQKAAGVINKIKTELNITHTVCVPGNHDVNRNLLAGIKGKAEIDETNLWKYRDKKLEYYKQFLPQIGLQDNANKAVVSCVVLENPKVLLLGLDSTHRIGDKDEYGFISDEDLRLELEQLFGKTAKAYKDYTKIAIMHHRPVIYESSSQSVTDNNSSRIGQYGTCDTKNWNKIKKILLAYDIHYVLTGHVHGTQSGQIRPCEEPNDQINYSTVGSLGVDFNREFIEKMELQDKTELTERIKNQLVELSFYGHHNAYNVWTISDTGLIQEEQYKYFIDEGVAEWKCWNTKIFQNEDISEVSDEGEENGGLFDKPSEQLSEQLKVDYDTPDYAEKLLTIVSEQQLYKTGHYHWKNSYRLNWLDTSYFFQHKDALFSIADGIADLFNRKADLKDIDCIIGLGIKGAILLSYIRFLFPDKACSYLPENKKEYNKYEWQLFEKNEKIKAVAVITDVVHSGETVKVLAKELHSKVGHFLDMKVITIFDTTSSNKIAGIEDTAKFSLFSLAKIRIFDCPSACDSCLIYEKRLANIIEYKEEQHESY